MPLPQPPEPKTDDQLSGPLTRRVPANTEKPGEWEFCHESYGYRIFKRLEEGLERFRAVPV